MAPSGFPTGTVSSGRDEPSDAHRSARTDDTDARARIAELERENEALRAAVEKQRRENERIVERYERLLEQERAEADAETADRETTTASVPEAGTLTRIARAFRR
ncbi:hypothetical protein [Haloplanus halobius]|uniref:hypothetical protein n=1 Tax=Haloplanus halobius TaxID=2934938 RepID=UPI00200EE9F2|nr:hypothetical protein [Haloplanus sp. XH21]